MGTRLESCMPRWRQKNVCRDFASRPSVQWPQFPNQKPRCNVSNSSWRRPAQLHQQGSVSVTTAGPAKRPRRREDFMCSCAEEVIEWISDRQFDIQEEITKGNAAEVARLSSLVVQAATSLQPVHFHGGAICPNTRDCFLLPQEV